MKKKILMIGANSNEGFAVLKALLKADFSVKAIIKNTETMTAKRIANKGAEIVQGSSDDINCLTSAMNGVHGVFSFQANAKGAKEVEQGTKIADAALKAGVKHFIYNSIGGAERNPGISHFEGKRRVEDHVRNINLPYTIFRPVTYMESFISDSSFILLSLLRSIMADKTLQMIAMEDLGKWVALAFSEPEKFIHKELEIAGDELNFYQIQKTFERVEGIKHSSVWLPSFLFGSGGSMFKFYKEQGYKANLQFCRDTIKDTLSFKEWLIKVQPSIV